MISNSGVGKSSSGVASITGVGSIAIGLYLEDIEMKKLAKLNLAQS